MSGKRYGPEEVIRKLREADVLIGEGVTVGEAIRRLGVNKVTYYRWRREFGGMKVDQAKRMKELERENIRLKKLVADLSLDNSILKEAAAGNW
jgi:putative transposase